MKKEKHNSTENYSAAAASYFSYCASFFRRLEKNLRLQLLFGFRNYWDMVVVVVVAVVVLLHIGVESSFLARAFEGRSLTLNP